MNDEEIKAIEYINKMLEYPKLYAHTGNESDFLRGIDKKQMETVLNLIEKQRTELEEKDKLLKLHTKLEYQYKNDYLNVIEDLKKKDKIIDLAINKVDHIDKCMICTNENCHECNSCMKEYFENKAKESK